MKAIVYYHYGSPDVLQFEEIEKPVPQDNEILIKVRAASVNPLDCGELKGVPYIFRIMLGLRKPEVTRPGRPGVDLAGQVDRCYRLSEVPEALRYLEEGHARGKVVITLE